VSTEAITIRTSRSHPGATSQTGFAESRNSRIEHHGSPALETPAERRETQSPQAEKAAVAHAMGSRTSGPWRTGRRTTQQIRAANTLCHKRGGRGPIAGTAVASERRIPGLNRLGLNPGDFDAPGWQTVVEVRRGAGSSPGQMGRKGSRTWITRRCLRFRLGSTATAPLQLPHPSGCGGGWR